MPTFKILVAYDGTGLIGWQRQPAGTSVQGLLEDALADLDQRAVTVIGAGRTDAGVHALEQVATFTLARDLEADAVVRAMNVRLPETVRVLTCEGSPGGFHPQFDSVSKTYRYRIWNGAVLPPFETRYAWHVPSALDVESMARAAALLEGRHDFAAFQATDSDTRTTERALTSSIVRCVRPFPLIEYEVTGDGFLRHMVRIIVGSLVDIGCGRRRTDWLRDVLESRDRKRAGRTAPPVGLFLVRVNYR